jgi:hypothetical protein
MAEESEPLYTGNGIEVTSTMVSWPGTHIPIRNISSVSLKAGFPWQHLNKLKKASYVLMALGFFLALADSGSGAGLFVIGIFALIWYWGAPCYIEINAGGTTAIMNKSTVRNSGEGQEQLLAAINQAIIDIQDK